ncbi:phage head-tail joining protein [Methylobacterium gnaphalii]|uniref:GpW protein n=1 Tax=Methylobacterium gnaphalii TaxID=1010610 RepID=A0A512JPB9_9HYPH|nr:hypothetical protein [Methylobacterium gnaphalii]GEP11810.1 hypothetical protein MGN01_36550 [Methylobacterium gnaphalii]GJD69487.1 hypothetical protein MMMDOFMJ_2418 [Methylobacterium gnaphalii]GLS49555.1 hypothetical protein GCM10007885_24040 [Methylobacterium gnaphalii]
MTWTRDDLDAINQAIGTAARKVRFADGREVEYRTLADMRSIRDEIASAIGAKPEPIRTTYAGFSRD